MGFHGHSPQAVWAAGKIKSVQEGKQRLGNLPPIPHSTLHLENADGETIRYMSDVEKESSGRVHPIPLSPVF